MVEFIDLFKYTNNAFCLRTDSFKSNINFYFFFRNNFH
jgi:hypothetical protein